MTELEPIPVISNILRIEKSESRNLGSNKGCPGCVYHDDEQKEKLTMRIIRMLPAVLLTLLLAVFGPAMAFAQGGQAAQSFTLHPGGKATITYEAYCTDFGLKFPTMLQAPNAVADDKVRGALAYIQSNNISADENKALEAQYGIWQLRGASGSPAGGDVAKAVVDAGNTAPANPQGTSVLDAIKAGQVKLTLGTWGPIGNKVPIGNASDNFYGRGELTIENTSQQVLTLYMPVGTLFPPNTAGEQTMAAYATNVQVNDPQQNQLGQLPNTADGSQGGEWLLFVGALALIIAGFSLRLRPNRK